MSSTGAGYDQSVSTYSPEGKLYQVEYAFKAVENSGTAVGVRCKDGVILGVEKVIGARMLVGTSGRNIATVDEHAGAATAGLIPDARQLISRARDESRGYRQNFGEAIVPRILAERMGGFVHAHTVYWYLRPFGASILLAAYDQEAKRPELYCVEPTGMALRYRAYAIGKGQRAAKTELEKIDFETKTCEEALGIIAKILLGVHDDAKDKPMEVELSWLSAATGWRHAMVSDERRKAAVEWARTQIEAEEMESEDED